MQTGMAEPKQRDAGKSRWVWPFELMQQIGEGGMGVVYRARYVVNNRMVAVKMLPADVTDKTALARFEREMAVLKDLRHPNIVRCFGGACEDKQRFYAMELVEGGSLEDVLQQRGRLPWEQVVEYALQMCAALECSHRHGVIHRDVKPGNFLIASNGQLKLSDFGLASVAAQRRITHAGKTAGTFLYMAPEQIRGGEITPRTDLYALGCVLFELLAGRPPFAAETPAATLHLHCKQPAPRVTQIALDCPEALETLILKLMEKDPAQRPESAAAVARELRGVTPTVSIVASRKDMGRVPTVGNRPVALPEREADTTQSTTLPRIVESRRSPWMLGAALAALMGLAVVGTWYWQLRSVAAEREQLWLQAFHSESMEVRAAAIEALGQMASDSEASRAALASGLESPDREIRRRCVLALGNAGSAAQAQTTALIQLQREDPDPEIRYTAEKAITKIQEDKTSGSFAGWILGMIGIAVAALWAGTQFRGTRRPPAAETVIAAPPKHTPRSV
jgi:serine/threonine-protein kinase